MPSEQFSFSWKQYCNWTTSKGFPFAFENLGPCLTGVQRKSLPAIPMSQERVKEVPLGKNQEALPKRILQPSISLTDHSYPGWRASWQRCLQGFLLLLVSEEDTCLWLPLNPGWLHESFLLSGRMSSAHRRSCRQASSTPRLTDSWRRRSMRSS